MTSKLTVRTLTDRTKFKLRYILTAAHCIYPEDETYVRLGDHNYEKEGETKFVVDIEVVKQWGHDDDGTDKDIGLMYLKESIKFRKYDGTIVPVCLPTEHLKYYNLVATVAGWGMHVCYGLLHLLYLALTNL